MLGFADAHPNLRFAFPLACRKEVIPFSRGEMSAGIHGHDLIGVLGKHADMTTRGPCSQGPRGSMVSSPVED